MDEKLKKIIDETTDEIRGCSQWEYDEPDFDSTKVDSILLRIYHAGCTAQSEADRVAVEKLLQERQRIESEYPRNCSLCLLTKALAALAAAAIKEE